MNGDNDNSHDTLSQDSIPHFLGICNFIFSMDNHSTGHGSCVWHTSIAMCCVIPLKVRVQKRDNGRNIVVLKYLQKKVSLDKYLMIVEIEF
jgi:hypothetical protein